MFTVSSGQSIGESIASTFATCAPLFSFAPEDVLDKTRENFKKWRISVQDALVFVPPLDIYVMGPVPSIPDKVDDPDAYAMWKSNDRLAQALLRRTISPSEIEAIGDAATAHTMWLMLLKRHGALARIEQADLLEEAASVAFIRGASPEETIFTIKSCVKRIFELGAPTEDDLVFMLLLRAASIGDGMIRSSYLDTLPTSSYPTVNALCGHIRANVKTSAHISHTGAVSCMGNSQISSELYKVAVEHRDYSMKEFRTPAIFSMGTDWAKVEVTTPGASFCATTADWSTYKDVTFNPRSIRIGPGNGDFHQAQVSFMIISSTPTVNLRTWRGSSEHRHHDNKGWSAIKFCDNTYMNHQVKSNNCDETFENCPVNYRIRTPAILTVNSDHAEMKIESQHTSVYKDPIANESVYNNVTFTKSSLRFDGTLGAGHLDIPFVFINKGEPVDYTVTTSSRSGESQQEKPKGAFVKFVETCDGVPFRD